MSEIIGGLLAFFLLTAFAGKVASFAVRSPCCFWATSVSRSYNLCSRMGKVTGFLPKPVHSSKTNSFRFKNPYGICPLGHSFPLPGAFLASVDVKDAFLHIPNCRVFTKVQALVLTLLHSPHCGVQSTAEEAVGSGTVQTPQRFRWILNL